MKKIATIEFRESQQRVYIPPELHFFNGIVQMKNTPEGILIQQSNKACRLCGNFAVFSYRHVYLCPMCKDLIKEG